jgi:hypothetical protein
MIEVIQRQAVFICAERLVQLLAAGKRGQQLSCDPRLLLSIAQVRPALPDLGRWAGVAMATSANDDNYGTDFDR